MHEDELELKLPENFTKEDLHKAITDSVVSKLHEAHKNSQTAGLRTKKFSSGKNE